MPTETVDFEAITGMPADGCDTPLLEQGRERAEAQDLTVKSTEGSKSSRADFQS